ncbi:MAG: TonB-dependent receptor [Chlorobi bacterium]|nr:TonB-dependent receptor [Chlorobiota bacterium]
MNINYSFSQTMKDTIKLNEIKVFERIDFAPIGSKANKIDSVSLAQNVGNTLSELIMDHSPLFIKSYGYGALASASFRGTSANQTQVLWNGININSPMLGQTDFSLIPVLFVDEVLINYGAGSLQETSGGIGGSINLINKPNWKNKLSVNFINSFGSFHSTNNVISVKAGSAKLQSSTKLFYVSSANNFNYFDRNKDTVLERKYADYNGKGALQEIYFRLNSNNIISGKLWLQKNYRNLPSNITVEEDSLTAFQKDNTIKSVIEWDNFSEKGKLKTYLSYIKDELFYSNKDLNLNTLSKSEEIKNQIKYIYNLTQKHHINTNVNYQHYRIISDNYKTIINAGIVNASVILNGKLITNLSYSLALRYENFDFNQSSGLMPLIGLEYLVFKKNPVTLYFNFAKNNRFPTMNELYWFPGGNKNLIPETSRNFETGIKYNKSINVNFNYKCHLTVYDAYIDNWIIWQPMESSNLNWMPVNSKKVHSRGIEAYSNLTASLSNYNINLKGFYNYALTTNMDIYNKDDSTIINKQLIYIPVNNLKAILNISNANNTFSFHYTFTDKRYVLADNSSYMPSYGLLDIIASRQFKYNKLSLNIDFAIKNITSVNYQSIENYPMPGRYYSFTLKIKYFD